MQWAYRLQLIGVMLAVGLKALILDRFCILEELITGLLKKPETKVLQKSS